jgi:hypothetical protein
MGPQGPRVCSFCKPKCERRRPPSSPCCLEPCLLPVAPKHWHFVYIVARVLVLRFSMYDEEEVEQGELVSEVYITL